MSCITSAFTCQVHPATQVSVPPLRVYTFIPVTGQIISRQVVIEAAEPGESEQSAESAANTKSKGSEQSAESAAKAKVVGNGSDAGPTDELDGEDKDELDDEDDLESNLKKLEHLEKKKKKGQAGDDGAPPSKKPKKS